MKIRMHVTVTGLVQGVSFRKHTLRMAERFNVNGWVRNIGDGSVLGCFEGARRDVETIVAWCSIGPERALVEEVRVDRQPYRAEYREFRILT